MQGRICERKSMGLWSALAGIVMALGLIMASGSPAQASSPIRLYEIYYNSPGRDAPRGISICGGADAGRLFRGAARSPSATYAEDCAS
jgi:hypothetical protein